MFTDSVYHTPCPNCGGEVERSSFSGDCHGSTPFAEIECKKCKRGFTQDEWDRIEESKRKRKRPAVRSELAHEQEIALTHKAIRPKTLRQLRHNIRQR